MFDDPIQFLNRYSGKLETEAIYGGKWLNWTYGTLLGKISLHGFVKRVFFSRWYGRRMDHPASRARIKPFIEQYQLDVSEFADAPDSFGTFNEFFFRKLKPEARPIAAGDDLAVFPADGRHLGFQNVATMDGIFVKGQSFDLADLLGDATLASDYQEGSMILSRLCPVDYHRFHFPVSGKASAARMINGPLYSVNPVALKQNIRIFSENKRAICRIETQRFGTVLMLEVGATCVGTMEHTYVPGAEASKGDEKGYFRFGGSSTILLFEKHRIRLDEDLAASSRKHRELYAKMGDRMGAAI
ncbi:MAG: archaetidylserine decarboxylase [Verrucomicrobia bacterium]|nr:archaetidylserine decarboxylase [Verrucomicrobiota bacterium]